jgi:transcriptional regulator with XRE-family HTH domain
MKIHERIKSIRLSKNLTQDYVATQIGISQRQYSKIESCEVKVDLERLQKLAEVFEINLSEMLSDEKNQVNNFNNNKLITNAVVNNYSQFQLDLQNEMILFLKEEVNLLKLQIEIKDKQISELIKVISVRN